MLILKSYMERWVRIFVVILWMLHTSLVSLLMSLSNMKTLALEQGTK